MNYIANSLSSLLTEITSAITNAGPNGWIIVSAVVIFVGFLCMRGYGSRSHY